METRTFAVVVVMIERASAELGALRVAQVALAVPAEVVADAQVVESAVGARAAGARHRRGAHHARRGAEAAGAQSAPCRIAVDGIVEMMPICN